MRREEKVMLWVILISLIWRRPKQSPPPSAVQKKPAFIAVTETSIRYAGLPIQSIVNLVGEIVESINGHEKVILHLDHGKNLEIMKEAINSGFSSVMIDGSALPLKRMLN